MDLLPDMDNFLYQIIFTFLSLIIEHFLFCFYISFPCFLIRVLEGKSFSLKIFYLDRTKDIFIHKKY